MMEQRGTRLDRTAGPTIDKLMVAGFEPQFLVEPLKVPLADESGNVWVAKAKLLLIPMRRPATRCKSPVGAEVFANVPVEGFQAEIDRGLTDLRDTYAEKCAREAAKLIKQAVPGVLR